MEDKDIIKALECCRTPNCKDCEKCPMFICKPDEDCVAKLMGEFLALINRQQAEIERLETEKDNLIKTYAECATVLVKEFAERLKEEINIRPTYSKEQNKFVLFIIGNLLKEMVGEG